jgi:hypothetical protein
MSLNNGTLADNEFDKNENKCGSDTYKPHAMK